ncbi:MAG: tyrosine-type recombinase/integrase [Firmicutes bacterium]|uniref:Integrase/recombinase XerC n=1 Tax=Melghirimyces thermohalophilus TaxID=1236220 RepID=A0A1G6IDZ4_9BACL|nr:tyrosine-type recombinase/integrase [Melghirimyces thermohalophilus]MDA8352801.1 tyrosine-type recombinase/integrase [Bacillota bacterium]SDC04620.1 integrase/recombinase XerC [Melghirimyces thermohalophilus]
MYIQPFQTWLQEKGRGALTQQEYLRTVRVLARWWEASTGKPFDPDQVTARDLHDWISQMKTVEHLAPSTINKRIAAIKTYWSFLTEAGHSTLNPTDLVRIRRASSLWQTPRWLTRPQQARFLHLVRKETNPWKRTRNLAMVQLMLQAGLRISEVVDLDAEDVDLERGTLVVRSGKGGKYRVALMNPDLKRAMEEWGKMRGETDSPAWLLSERGKERMTRQGMHYLIRKFLDQLGLADYSAHSLRHSFCRNLIDAGQPLQVVAQLAGHEILETTRRYITPSEHDLRKAVDSISESKE